MAEKKNETKVPQNPNAKNGRIFSSIEYKNAGGAAPIREKSKRGRDPSRGLDLRLRNRENESQKTTSEAIGTINNKVIDGSPVDNSSVAKLNPETDNPHMDAHGIKNIKNAKRLENMERCVPVKPCEEWWVDKSSDILASRTEPHSMQYNAIQCIIIDFGAAHWTLHWVSPHI